MIVTGSDHLVDVDLSRSGTLYNLTLKGNQFCHSFGEELIFLCIVRECIATIPMFITGTYIP